MKAELKALTRLSNLTGTFKTHLTLHEALQQMFFECFSSVS